MLIDHINLNHIRIFECVYRSGSMTAAAKELHLTQSGVSQHMKSLEDMLSVKLFDRIQQRIVPTAAASDLFKKCAAGLLEIESGLSTAKGTEHELTGSVSVGMPVEFGNNVVLPLLAQLTREHAGLRFKLRLEFASSLNDQLLRGDLDFAFVDQFQMDRRIRTEAVYDEILELCASDAYLKKRGPFRHQRKFFEGLEYVEYQEDEPLLRSWFHHHLGSRGIDLNVRFLVMDTQAVARLILQNAGAGILPGHLVSQLQRQGHKIRTLKGAKKPLKNSISIAYLSERTHSPVVRKVLDEVRKALTT